MRPDRRFVRRNVVVVARYRRYRLALLLLVPLLGLPAMGRAQEGNRAGVIVVKGDGQVLTACVAFSEPTISGMGLLERSGLDFTLQASAGNATVCSIAGEGCSFPGDACFCQCQGGGPCRYWSYWHQNGGVWQYASTGAPLHRVQPGGVDGWTWGEGSSGAAPRPPAITFDAICPVPVVAPPVEPVPTLAPVPAEPSPTLPPPIAPPTATRPRPSATRPAPTTVPPSPTQRPAAAPPSATPALVEPTQPRVVTPTSAPPPVAAEPPIPSATVPLAPSATPVAPTPAQVVPTSTPTISPSPESTPSSSPSATGTPLPSPTSVPSASTTSTATVVNEPPATPTLVPPPATPPPVVEQPSGRASYVLFGGTLAFLLTGLALAWRRRR